MEKRRIKIGAYDTAEGLWTLTSWNLSKAEAVEEYASVPGHNGLLDLSTAITDDEPYYNSREFEAVLESSEGTRLERKARIDDMINTLDGWRAKIILPDDDTRYIIGRVRVEELYNTPAHCSVKVTATVDPWRYNQDETIYTVIAGEAEKTVVLTNSGKCSVVPIIKVSDNVILTYTTDTDEFTWALSAGEYRTMADLYLKTGSYNIKYRGSGQIIFTFREAVL